MAKIRIIQPTFDNVTSEQYPVGTVLDLGAVRNKRAVETNQAVYVDSEKLEKTLEAGQPITKKVDAQMPRDGVKNKVVKGKTNETK